MSLLDHLWDETVAGPRPDSGLGKLRKYSSFSPSSSSSAATAPGSFQVTRSITILRPATSPRSAIDSASSSAPSSPASVPDSPLTPTGLGGERRRLRNWKPTPMAEVMETAEPRSPTVYDWPKSSKSLEDVLCQQKSSKGGDKFSG